MSIQEKLMNQRSISLLWMVKKIYYQVAATVRDENTLKRELSSLQKISDHYQKIILTLDEDPEADYNGIRRINVLEWLIEKQEFIDYNIESELY